LESGAAIVPSRGAHAASAAVVALEVIGALLMWGPIPLAWLWIGGRIYAATGSLAADGFIGFAGFIATVLVVVAGLRRIDAVWIGLRRRAGHDQAEGALQEVVTISGAFGLVAFALWYYAFSHAYVLPFMPSG
jgi:small-conductance mechanosensitive channel